MTHSTGSLPPTPLPIEVNGSLPARSLTAKLRSMSEPPKTLRPQDAMSAAMADILEDGLAIQDRFVAEPLLKTTGRGGLKPRGAESLKQDAQELVRKLSRAAKKTQS